MSCEDQYNNSVTVYRGRADSNAGSQAPSHSQALQVQRLAASSGRNDEDGSEGGAGHAGGGGDDSYQGAAPARASSRHTHLLVLSNLEMEIKSILIYSLNINFLSKYNILRVQYCANLNESLQRCSILRILNQIFGAMQSLFLPSLYTGMSRFSTL